MFHHLYKVIRRSDLIQNSIAQTKLITDNKLDMENKLLKIQEEMFAQIQDFYEEVRLLLMDEKSYERKIEANKVELLFLLVENTLQKPLNRLAHIDGFLSDPDGLMVGKMYPFAYLLPKYLIRLRRLSENQQNWPNLIISFILAVRWFCIRSRMRWNRIIG